MRNSWFLICILGMSCALWAQGDQASWTNLSVLHPGQKIQIVEMNSHKHSGTFVSFSETAILYQDNAGGQTIPRQDVHRVRLMENKHHLRNALIGGVVGAGAGAGIGAGSWENNGFVGGKGVGAAVGATIGFAAGTVVGVLLPGHHTIYRVN
ncbi:MAG: hypothetical protein WA676_07575 [Candidatus Sulfotelmatobacter sp.]